MNTRGPELNSALSSDWLTKRVDLSRFSSLEVLQEQDESLFDGGVAQLVRATES